MPLTTRLRNTCVSLMLALFPLVWQPAVHAQTQTQALESELKAAIIANMLLFVEWPSESNSASEQLTICYLESSPVAGSLAQLDGRSIKGKSLKVVQISPDKLPNCHALYLAPAGGSSILSKISSGSFGTLHVLLVSDTPGLLQRGIMVNLEQVSGRIVFDIDLKALQSSGLKLSSKALRLARQVVE